MPDSPIACVRAFMTAHPHTIGVDLPLGAARAKMFELDVHHLPVVRGERLVGVVSASDIALVEDIRRRGGLRGAMTVADAMRTEPFTCIADAHLPAIAREMASRKQDCAVVFDADHPARICGVFTTIDALRALSLLGPQEPLS